MTPHTYIVVACTSDRRWFDLDAVRTEPVTGDRVMTQNPRQRDDNDHRGSMSVGTSHPAGAPPLDWWTDEHTNEPDTPATSGKGETPVTARLLIGDVRTRIKEIPDGTIDLVCTSPPFLALRKYGDNDAEMGSERNPADFIDALLELTGEFRRVLAPHGTIAIELGDTYSGSGGAGGDYNDDGLRAGQAKFDGSASRMKWDRSSGRKAPGGQPYADMFKDKQPTGGNGWPLAKSLACVPGAYALSLAYGWNVLDRHGPDSPAGRWRVRNIIVWARPNPPVGALGDKVRPATSYITIACTSATRWFDLDAVRTEPTPHALKYADADTRARHGNEGYQVETRGDGGRMTYGLNPAGVPPLDWCEDNDPTGHTTIIQPTAPYPGAHYATWPPTLARRLIEMMCPLKVCVECGEPSRRIVGEAEYVPTHTHRSYARRFDADRVADGINQWKDAGANTSVTRNAPTLGWSDCGHDAWRPGHVLDPFAGSGTTLAVATGCGRAATGIELYPANGDLIADRLGMFLEIVA